MSIKVFVAKKKTTKKKTTKKKTTKKKPKQKQDSDWGGPRKK
jgi:hypothetical protein